MAYRTYISRINNPVKRSLDRRIYKCRKRLRELSILPPVGVEMTNEQQLIYNQLGKGDFTFWDMVKTSGGIGTKLHNGGCRINSQSRKFKKPEKLLWERLKQNAKKSDKDFNIDVDDIHIPEYCPYLNIKLSTNLEDRYCQNYYTGDRIDSNLGYIKGNVQVISYLANTMKNNATIEQLIEFSKNILRLYS